MGYKLLVGAFSMLLLVGVSCAWAAEPVYIAAVFAKQGEAAAAGHYNYRGVQMAVADVNAGGGLLGRPVKVLELDNRSTPLGARKAGQDAVESGAVGVVGATWSSLSLAMAPVLQENGVPMVATMSSNPAVTLVGNYIFRICFTDPFQGKVMAMFAREDLQAETTVLLENVSSDYSRSLNDSFGRAFAMYGGTVLWRGEYQEEDADFTRMLTAVRDLGPDVVFLPGYMRDSSLIIKQARSMGIQAVFLGGDGWGSEMFEYAGPVVNGNFAAAGWHPSVELEESRKMVHGHREQFGAPPVDNTVMAYDATMVLADAVRRAGTFEGPAVRAALAATRDYPGVSGAITFDANGDPVDKDAVVLLLQSGEMVFQKSVKP